MQTLLFTSSILQTPATSRNISPLPCVSARLQLVHPAWGWPPPWPPLSSQTGLLVLTPPNTWEFQWTITPQGLVYGISSDGGKGQMKPLDTVEGLNSTDANFAQWGRRCVGRPANIFPPFLSSNGLVWCMCQEDTYRLTTLALFLLVPPSPSFHYSCCSRFSDTHTQRLLIQIKDQCFQPASGSFVPGNLS